MFGWGANDKSQLGLLSDSVFKPQKLDFPSLCLKNDDSFSSISCGKEYSIFVTTNGHLYSSGDSSKLHSLNTSEINSNIVEVSCGDYHTLAITSDFGIVSWGSNSHGQLGKQFSGNHVDYRNENIPSLIKGPLSGLPIVQVSCGSLHSLALARNGTLYSWGCNYNGQLGLGANISTSFTPQPVKNLFGLPLRTISAGGNHSLAVTFSSSVFSWGCNSFGQLGLETESDSVSIPKNIKDLRSHSITNLSCGGDHSAAWSTFTGKVFTFGRNNAYQLGHNENKDSHIPRQPPFLEEHLVSNVVCGDLHTIFVTESWTLFASGSNVNGQLGNTPSSHNFCQFSIENCDVAAIASGGNHVICVNSDIFNLPPSNDFTIRHINDLTWMLKLSNKAPVPKTKMNLIEEVFKSRSCINASFLLPDDGHMKCSNSNCGLDYNLMSEMSKCRNSMLLQKIVKCLETHVLPKLQEDVPDYESLRLYFILVNLPIFSDMKNLDTLTIPFTKALMSLGKIPSKAINKWLISAPIHFIRRYLEVFKEAAMFIFKSGQLSNPDVYKQNLNFILQVIKKIHIASQDAGDPVNIQEFYINNLYNTISQEFEYLQRRVQEMFEGTFKSTIDHLHGLADLEKRLSHIKALPFQLFSELPFLYNLSDKAFMFRWFSCESMNRAAFQCLPSFPMFQWNDHFLLEIDRENILNSALKVVRRAAPLDLRKPLAVKFSTDNINYTPGGVVKEFFLLALQNIMDPECGLFEVIKSAQVHWFMPSDQDKLELFYFAGVLCGLAIYNDAIIDLKFPEVVYKKLLDHKLTLNDLSDIDPELCKSFKEMLLYNDDDFSEVYDCEFQIDDYIGGKVQTVNLIENGGNIKVTQENKPQYVEAYQTYLISGKIEKEFEQFKLGFFKVCDKDILLKFHPSELLQLVAGSTNYDLPELQRTTTYRLPFSEHHETIGFFWDVLRSFSVEESKKFLKFLTGTSHVPITGLSSIKLEIIPQEDESESTMPSALVCFNMLFMPMYETRGKLSQKLKNAINGQSRLDDNIYWKLRNNGLL